MIYWEDLAQGQTYTTPSLTVEKADILEFAEEFDPQPFHLDQDAGDESIFGGLCASGWHICALMMRLLADTFMRENIASLGSPGIPQLRWRKPVYAEDVLHALITIGEGRLSKSNPAMGLLQCSIDVKNQHDDNVITMTSTLLIGRRPQGAVNE